MGVGPIPGSAIDRMADRMDLDPDEHASFTAAIRAMDRVYLDDVGKRMDAQRSGRPSAVASRPMSADLFDAVFGA